MMVEAYLRRGRRRMEQLLLEPGIRGLLLALFYGGSGFLLTAASLGNSPQPIAMGMICGFTGWRAVLITLGALAGYPTFWGSGGLQGIAWAASAGLLALLLGRREESRNQPLMIPAIAAFLTAITGLCFQLLLRDRTPPLVYGLRIGLTGLTAMLFTQAVRCRDPVTDWLIGALATLALAQIPLGMVNPGCVAAGVLAVSGAFPAAALAGLGLDLAQVTKVPMTAAVCLGWFIRLIPFDKRWQHYAAPGFGALAVMAACGIWDWNVLPGLVSLRYLQEVNKGTRPFYYHPIFVVGIVTVVVIAALYWFFGTERGASIRATGANEHMARAQGINTNVNKVLGLALSNGLVAFAGALLCQYQSYAEINMGRGAIVIGLASVIIGEVAFSRLFRNFALKLLSVSLGAIIYYIVIQAVISLLKIDSNYLKLISALIVAFFLAVPYWKSQLKPAKASK